MNKSQATNQVYNIACGKNITLNELFDLIRKNAAITFPKVLDARLLYRDFRPGDIRHSLAYIDKAKQLLGYEPMYSVIRGIEKTAVHFCKI
jgi:UDP-N-acetylglucosamine 4-epimerase